MSGKDDFMDEFYDGPYPEETLRSTEVACCEETARKVLSRTREIMELQGQINKVLQKSLDSKKKEIMELKEELNTVELLRIERKPQVSREFKQFLQKHDRNRPLHLQRDQKQKFSSFQKKPSHFLLFSDIWCCCHNPGCHCQCQKKS